MIVKMGMLIFGYLIILLISLFLNECSTITLTVPKIDGDKFLMVKPMINMSSIISPSGYVNKRNEAQKLKILERYKSLKKTDLKRSRRQAATKLQSNLKTVLEVLTRNENNGIPANVKTSAKTLNNVFSSAEGLQVLSRALPKLISTNNTLGTLNGNCALQLDNILKNVSPYVSQSNRSPLDVLRKFLRANLNGVTTLLSRVLGGVPDLLKGVINGLLAPLGAVADAVDGTIASLGDLLGGLLSGLT